MKEKWWCNLYYYNARYYDPTLGRFIQADAIIADLFAPQNINPYTYVLNNPLKYTDPTGYFVNGPEDESVFVPNDANNCRDALQCVSTDASFGTRKNIVRGGPSHSFKVTTNQYGIVGASKFC